MNVSPVTSSRGSAFVAAWFLSALVTATLIGSKLTTLGGITFSVGLFVFPFTFISMEVAAEVYGKGFARDLIKMGVVLQFFVLIWVSLGGLVPQSPLREIGDSYSMMFGLAPRMILASITAYLLGQFLDVFVFLKLKERFKGRHLWLRANGASLVSQAVDTLVFSTVFLYGVIPNVDLLKAAGISYFVKVTLAAVDTPFVYWGRSLVRALDRRNESIPGFSVVPIKTPIFRAHHRLVDFIVESIPRDRVREGIVLAITSKIISIEERRIVSRDSTTKGDLIRKESDVFLGETLHGVALTIKHGILIPSAGIDESNSDGENYILFPKDPYASARKIWIELRQRWGLNQLGIIITDSHTQPLRKGVTGIGLAHWGFRACKNLIGQKDLFGREIKMTHVNALDALAVSAVYQMGEVDECCPLALIYGSGVEFTSDSSLLEVQIARDEDLYGHLLFPKV